MLLAAGAGTRLDPLTRRVPKPMVPVMNRPVMEHILKLLVRHRFDEVTVNLHTMGEMIERHFGDGSRWGASITYAREDRLWGDAGSVKRAEEFFRDDTFLVIGGDDITDMDLGGLIAFHKERGAVATIALAKVEDPSEYGIAELGEGGRIVGFREKPKTAVPSRLANTGIYVFESEVLDMIPRGEKHGLGKNLLPRLLEEGAPFFGWEAAGYWCDVGAIGAYHQAHRDALRCRIALVDGYLEVRPSVWVGEGVKMHETARLEPPVLLGDGCRVEEGAVVGSSVLGPGCTVRAGAAVQDCVLWEQVRLGKGAALQSCIAASGCQVACTGEIHGAVIV
jgi:NDP-sugar pyrophosphorylase family protein